MKSEDLLLLWDDLFIPGQEIEKKDDTIKKKYMIPAFCSGGGKPPNLESIQILWGLVDPDEKKEGGESKRAEAKRAAGSKKVGNRRGIKAS